MDRSREGHRKRASQRQSHTTERSYTSLNVSGHGYAQVILRCPTGLVITITLHAEDPELRSDRVELVWDHVDIAKFDAASG